jgi:hypothetical protein
MLQDGLVESKDLTADISWPVSLVPVDQLRPSEECNDGRVKALAAKIGQEGFWSAPLLIEAEHRIVMDGHHRLSVARALQLSVVPCLLLSYDDPHLQVTSWVDSAEFDHRLILDAGRTGSLLPYKSTRHRLSGNAPECKIPLDHLRAAASPFERQ